jgi:hypothetical protein
MLMTNKDKYALKDITPKFIEETIKEFEKGAKEKTLVTVYSSASCMKYLQDAMAGEAEKAGFSSEEDVNTYISEMRKRSK